MRSKFDDVGSNVQDTGGDNVDRSQGAARAISSFIDPGLSWKDIPWFLSITEMPIILKGVQRVDDVLRVIMVVGSWIRRGVGLRFWRRLCLCLGRRDWTIGLKFLLMEG